MANEPEILKPEISEKRDVAPNTAKFDIDEIWKIVCENVRLYISPRDYKTWFKGVFLEKVENGIAELSCDRSFQREYLEQYHRGLITRSLSQATGQRIELTIKIRSSVNNSTPKTIQEVKVGQDGSFNIFSEVQDKIVEGKDKLARQAQLNPKYLFSNFIVGTHNALSHAVAESVVKELGTLYNPVFFYGPTGVGKTHLMQAIGNEVINNYPDKKVVYVPIEQFLNELIESIRTRTNEKFRKKYREIDLLIIDDIQFVETYPKTQEELFHTFNTLYQSNKQMIMAADRPPKEIKNITDRLRSRFSGGMVADLQAPDYETRMAILQQIAAEQNTTLDRETVELIAKNVENNVRELEGAAIKIISMRRLGQEVNLEQVAKTLQLDLESKRKRIKPERIMDVVCEIFDVTPRDIKGKRRTAYLATTRQVIMYILRNELGLPLERVAREVNRQDHTTVLHACEKIEDMMEKDSRFKDKIETCKSRLG
ncbi:MAG: Chromosomal replication initiator protein DnaA [candidate division WS6 bacterium GW2011_GWF2_39_15]|uniref:Chromosomal replication initiator protein DnaA n=1 Tax=candidate division WS6 bacterium GW2011_GWF2_39_15 TaxID=1619100 RepID=A0A0G0N0X4_9BACT|nr:MAG: Chromosomal replication initiator protein DnaA [candidate division WS6 bacterium GW2011_GWF2_39_15]